MGVYLKRLTAKVQTGYRGHLRNDARTWGEQWQSYYYHETKRGRQRLLELGRRGSCKAELLMRSVTFSQGTQPARANPKGGSLEVNSWSHFTSCPPGSNRAGSALPAHYQRRGHRSPLLSPFSSAFQGREYSEKGGERFWIFIRLFGS